VHWQGQWRVTATASGASLPTSTSTTFKLLVSTLFDFWRCNFKLIIDSEVQVEPKVELEAHTTRAGPLLGLEGTATGSKLGFTALPWAPSPSSFKLGWRQLQTYYYQDVFCYY
jgi:hypothetical protein